LLRAIAAEASPLLFGKFFYYYPEITQGQMLINVVYRGINEGRQAAREVDLYLEKSTALPVTGGIVKSTAQEVFHAVSAAATTAVTA